MLAIGLQSHNQSSGSIYGRHAILLGLSALHGTIQPRKQASAVNGRSFESIQICELSRSSARLEIACQALLWILALCAR